MNILKKKYNFQKKLLLKNLKKIKKMRFKSWKRKSWIEFLDRISDSEKVKVLRKKSFFLKNAYFFEKILMRFCDFLVSKNFAYFCVLSTFLQKWQKMKKWESKKVESKKLKVKIRFQKSWFWKSESFCKK